MAIDRKLIDYLPPFMREYLEMQKIMEVEQAEFDSAWERYENTLADQFIMDTTEHGISRWENMLKISPKDTDTLEERKFRVLVEMNQELPYTMMKLKEALTAMCGSGNFSIDLQAANYHIEVKLGIANLKNYQKVVDLLKKMVPANMTQYVHIMYNAHNVLTKFTHAQLAAYTHEQLRNEVFK